VKIGVKSVWPSESLRASDPLVANHECGHEAAEVETSLPQSVHFVRAMSEKHIDASTQNPAISKTQPIQPFAKPLLV
jgi:hypothetical protein